MPDFIPENCRCYAEDGFYKVKWLEGNSLPSILDITVSDVSEEDEDEENGYDDDGILSEEGESDTDDDDEYDD